jgi:hypothetical protein
MNEYVYTPQLYEVVRDSYRRDARRLFVAAAGQQDTRPSGPTIGSRFAAAWAAFFAHDGRLPAREGQRA